MKIGPLITACLVALGLYALVFERGWLMDFAAGGSADGPPPEAVVEQPPATPRDAAAARRVGVVVIDSQAGTVDNAVVLRGRTEAVRQVDVRAETSGLILSEPLRKGQKVSAGDVLCQIDPGIRPIQLQEAEAGLAEAEINDTAAAKLAERGFGSQTGAVGAKASLQAAQAKVELARKEIERLTVRTPFDGLLESDTAELGSLMQAGSLCATVIQLDPIKIVGFLPESVLRAVVAGAPARAQISNGREVTGEITFLSRSADPSTRTFRVEMETANADLSISDGQSATIEIAAKGVSAHRVPSSALTLSDDGTMGLRLVDAGDVVQFVPVKVMRDTSDGVLVTGLPDLARIIVVGQEYVTDGVQVDVTVRADRS